MKSVYTLSREDVEEAVVEWLANAKGIDHTGESVDVSVMTTEGDRRVEHMTISLDDVPDNRKA